MKYILILLFLCGCSNSPQSLTTTLNNGTVSISVDSRMANAISSVIWNNREYLNISDNGRGMQSTIRTQEAGECYNPTEAGSVDDNGISTSIILLTDVENSVLTTSTQMAYWLHPTDPITANCNVTHQVLNTTVDSNEIINKTIQLNAFGMTNVISLEKDMYIGDNAFQNISGVEINTAYLASEFHVFYLYDISTHTITPLNTSLNTTPVNINGNVGIVSTEDGRWAMGEYYKGNVQTVITTSIMLNGYDDGNTLVNILDVVTYGQYQTGWQNWQLYLVFGTLNDVKNTLDIIAL